jgi:hypothetical protein
LPALTEFFVKVIKSIRNEVFLKRTPDLNIDIEEDKPKNLFSQIGRGLRGGEEMPIMHPYPGPRPSRERGKLDRVNVYFGPRNFS